VTSGILLAGVLVGVLYGLFGVGASFATPALSFLGIPPLAAVVSPLPGFLPSSMAGAWSYARRGKVDWPLAGRVIAGALPAAVVGAATSQHVGGRSLLVLQALTLVLIGTRVLWPRKPTLAAGSDQNTVRWGWAVVAGAVVVGFLSGLLANGGGFLLVPWFLMVLGLDMHRATGTSLLVAASLTVPTIAVHGLVGDVDWWVAAPFAVGVVPGAVLGAWLAQHVPTGRLRLAFGVLLVVIGLYYLPTQLLA
jgi:uncharacterized membrane protein YfcA